MVCWLKTAYEKNTVRAGTVLVRSYDVNTTVHKTRFCHFIKMFRKKGLFCGRQLKGTGRIPDGESFGCYCEKQINGAKVFLDAVEKYIRQ